MGKAISRMEKNRSLGTVTDRGLAIWGCQLGNTGSASCPPNSGISTPQLRRQGGHRKGRGVPKPGGTELCRQSPRPALECEGVHAQNEKPSYFPTMRC